MQFVTQRIVRRHWKLAYNLLVDGDTENGNGPCRSSCLCLQLVSASNIDVQLRIKDSLFVRLRSVAWLRLGFCWCLPIMVLALGAREECKGLSWLNSLLLLWSSTSIIYNHFNSNVFRVYDILLCFSYHHGTIQGAKCALFHILQTMHHCVI